MPYGLTVSEFRSNFSNKTFIVSLGNYQELSRQQIYHGMSFVDKQKTKLISSHGE